MVEKIKKDREGPPRIHESIKRTKGRGGKQRGYEERKEENNNSSGGGSGGGKKRVPLRLSK